MSHKHETCASKYGFCTEGRLTDFCTYESCDNPWCSDLGHCECKCHSGKTCDCGHVWPRMEKQ